MNKIQQSTIVRYRGDLRITIPESIARNLTIKPNDFIFIEYKDNSIIVSPAEVSKK